METWNTAWPNSFSQNSLKASTAGSSLFVQTSAAASFASRNSLSTASAILSRRSAAWRIFSGSPSRYEIPNRNSGASAPASPAAPMPPRATLLARPRAMRSPSGRLDGAVGHGDLVVLAFAELDQLTHGRVVDHAGPVGHLDVLAHGHDAVTDGRVRLDHVVQRLHQVLVGAVEAGVSVGALAEGARGLVALGVSE